MYEKGSRSIKEKIMYSTVKLYCFRRVKETEKLLDSSLRCIALGCITLMCWKCWEFLSYCSGLSSIQLPALSLHMINTHTHQAAFHKGFEVAKKRDYQKW